MSGAHRIAAVALALLLTGGVALGARCASATEAQCSIASLTGDAPALDVPYARTRLEVVKLMMDMAAVRPGDRVVDLGTGDGRVLLAAAERGATGLGVDIDPVLVEEARGEAERRGLADRARFRVEDLFRTPLGNADVLAMFLLPEVNLKLRPRILSDMRPGARVVSHAFDMGDWPPDARGRAGGARVYLWRVPASVAGCWRLIEPGRPPADLVLTQRYQLVGGALGTERLEGRVDGPRIRLTAGGRSWEGKVAGDAITGPGWRAERADLSYKIATR
ncbi:SAM-dependent methyltransferase [Sphingomonas lenta]|uniref:SAM-dependent methyltransferase n=1 Tax=Sphingomonas lenta TaxID=1141887 RepID=UPI0011409A4B|nr:class I SAM-dependent methyltransferase [Sphingomonas lenta]